MKAQPTKRRRRDRRLKGVPDRGLSDRDLDVLAAVYEFRVMSQPQLRQSCFGACQSATVATRALARLYDTQYLDRRILPVRDGRGPNYYLLDRRGAEALRRELGYGWVKFYPSYRTLSDGAVRHLLAVGDFRILMTEACQKLGLELDWLSEVRMRTPGGYDRVQLNGRRVGIIPDGACCITSPQGDKTILFLELDRVSRQVSHFRHKVLLYLRYAQEDAYYARFGRWLTAERRAERRAVDARADGHLQRWSAPRSWAAAPGKPARRGGKARCREPRVPDAGAAPAFLVCPTG